MRLCLLSILLLFSLIVSGQSKVGRSGDPVTVEDWRLFAKYNFRPPVFRDTADANLHLGLDSCGAMIFTRPDNKLWKRLCSPKKWEEIGSGSGVESDPVWTADKPSFRTKLQNDALYYPLTGNPSGFLTSFSETDPVYSASSWFSTTNNSSNWNTAFGWGNHASAGYLTSFSETDPVWGAEKSGYLTAAAAALAYSPIGHSHDFASITSKPSTISGYGITITAGDVPTLNQNTTGNAATATALQSGRLINGVSFDGTTNLSVDIRTIAYQLLGSTIVAHNVNGGLGDATGSQTMVDNRLFFSAVYLPVARTITGVKWKQVTQGNYTADNYNGFGLYSYSGGTLTLVASTTDDGNIWKASSNTIGSKAFSSAYAAAAGIYFIGGIYCNSSQTTAPVLGSVLGSTGSNTINDFTNSAKLSGFVSGLTSLPSPTQASSGITAYFVENWYGLY